MYLKVYTAGASATLLPHADRAWKSGQYGYELIVPSSHMFNVTVGCFRSVHSQCSRCYICPCHAVSGQSIAHHCYWPRITQSLVNGWVLHAGMLQLQNLPRGVCAWKSGRHSASPSYLAVTCPVCAFKLCERKKTGGYVPWYYAQWGGVHSCHFTRFTCTRSQLIGSCARPHGRHDHHGCSHRRCRIERRSIAVVAGR